MAQKLNDFNAIIKASLLANNSFGIMEVNDLENVNSFYFVPEHYKETEKLLKDGDVKSIRNMPINNAESSQFYYVITFTDQKKKKYVVTIYDNNELWQDPQIIEIFPIT